MSEIKVDDLVGKPFVYGARGPDAYDCYGLLMEVYRRLGIEIPDYERPSDYDKVAALMQQDIVLWKPCEQKPGAAMYMKIATQPHHVGVYLNWGRFIHAFEGSGQVVIDSVNNWKKRIVGYYEYVGS